MAKQSGAADWDLLWASQKVVMSACSLASRFLPLRISLVINITTNYILTYIFFFFFFLMYSFLEHLIASGRLKGGVLCSSCLSTQRSVIALCYLSGKKRLNNAKGNRWPNMTSSFLNDTKPHIAFIWCQAEGRLFATECVPCSTLMKAELEQHHKQKTRDSSHFARSHAHFNASAI